MNENEFIEKLESEKPMLDVWGKHIKSYILAQLEDQGLIIEDFIKIPCIPRIKENKSILEKAFYRNKNYADPYNDITDKVGLRLVVLNVQDIDIICKIVENQKLWTASEDVDYKKDRNEKPELFTYQSVHYIVRNISDIKSEILIPANTPCEIQIRTLLQHAYAELSHDTVYKKEEDISPEIKRKMARSMALIEATDELFKEVHELIDTDNAEFGKIISIPGLGFDNVNFVEKLNRFIYDSFKALIKKNQIGASDIQQFVEDRHYLIERVSDKGRLYLLYKQPIIYLLYYLIFNYRYAVKELWPLNSMELEPFFSDLGFSFDP